MARLRVLFIVSECVPFAKTGGLGDVAGALPIALAERGHDVRIVMPRYRVSKAVGGEKLSAPLGIPLGHGDERWAAVWRHQLSPNATVYLIEHDVLFDRDGIYHDAHGSFGDNALRYALLCRAARQLRTFIDFAPDIVHAHDWQTSLACVLGRLSNDRAASILTIHNLGYQGVFAAEAHRALGLSWQQCIDNGMEQAGHLNLLKAGICNATMLSTVSPRYAQEIQTDEGGAGLAGTLRWRQRDLVGILNGIDTSVWDPQTDPHLPAHFSHTDMAGKATCKRVLQQRMGLDDCSDTPLIGIVSRLVEQKGIDIIVEALPAIVSRGAQIVIVGNGPAWVEQALEHFSHQSPQLRVRFGFDEALAHLVEAGADLFLMPSRYEPCGLNQMYSQRYGTLPVVRAVGGLRDSVEHGVTGFTFDALSGDALSSAVHHALDCYAHRPQHFAAMQQSAMRKDMSWNRAASHYEAMYRLAIKKRSAQLAGITPLP